MVPRAGVEPARPYGFGLPSMGPVHGLANEGGTTIYPADEEIRFFGLEATGHVSSPVQEVIRVIVDGIMNSDLKVVSEDERVATAVDLYLAHFYVSSIRARFLTLMMLLEVLAPVTKRHPVILEMIGRWKAEIEGRLRETQDADALDALEAIDRELEFRKETSIRRRVRRLVLDSAPLDEPSRRELAKRIVQAYDLCGSLIHSGHVDAQLHEAYTAVLSTVKLLLRGRLGLKYSQQS